MTQPGFDFSAPVREKKRGRVPRTSVVMAQALHDGGYLEHREREMLHALTGWTCVHASGFMPTSAELAAYHGGVLMPTTDDKLYVRRGLSALLAKGAVEHAGERVCVVTKRRCVCWRVVSR